MGSGAPAEISVDVRGRQESRSVVDSQGGVILTDPLKPTHFQIDLRWLADGWRVVETLGVDG